MEIIFPINNYIEKNLNVLNKSQQKCQLKKKKNLLLTYKKTLTGFSALVTAVAWFTHTFNASIITD